MAVAQDRQRYSAFTRSMLLVALLMGTVPAMRSVASARSMPPVPPQIFRQKAAGGGGTGAHGAQAVLAHNRIAGGKTVNMLAPLPPIPPEDFPSLPQSLLECRAQNGGAAARHIGFSVNSTDRHQHPHNPTLTFLVMKKYRMAYIVMPKCGSTTMRTYLREFEFKEQHFSPDLFNYLRDEGFFIFTFIRDPLAHWVSGFTQSAGYAFFAPFSYHMYAATRLHSVPGDDDDDDDDDDNDDDAGTGDDDRDDDDGAGARARRNERRHAHHHGNAQSPRSRSSPQRVAWQRALRSRNHDRRLGFFPTILRPGKKHAKIKQPLPSSWSSSHSSLPSSKKRTPGGPAGRTGPKSQDKKQTRKQSNQTLKLASEGTLRAKGRWFVEHMQWKASRYEEMKMYGTHYFMNRHIDPMVRRLLLSGEVPFQGPRARGAKAATTYEPLQLDFLGRLEHLEEDWTEMLTLVRSRGIAVPARMAHQHETNARPDASAEAPASLQAQQQTHKKSKQDKQVEVHHKTRIWEYCSSDTPACRALRGLTAAHEERICQFISEDVRCLDSWYAPPPMCEPYLAPNRRKRIRAADD